MSWASGKAGYSGYAVIIKASLPVQPLIISKQERAAAFFFFLIAGVNCLAHLCLTPPPTPPGTAALSHAAAEKDTAVSIQRKMGKEGD